MASDYSHTPKDVQDAIKAYDDNVTNGVIRPWNPDDTSDEYTGEHVTDDRWIADHLAEMLPDIYTGYTE